jgi:hypothetical protein
MIELELIRAPAGRFTEMAIRLAKAAAEAHEIDWDLAHIEVKLPMRRTLVKLPGHMALKEI